MKLKAIILSGLLIGCSSGKGKSPSPAPESLGPAASAPPPVASITTRLLGHDLLGALSPHFNVAAAGRQITPGSPLGFLDVTFSDSLANAETLISTIRPRYVRAHLANTVCVRNNNCGPYEPWGRKNVLQLNQAIEAHDAAILGHIKHRAGLWKALSEKYRNTGFLISPALEHNLTPAAYRVLADAVLEVWPNVQLVNSAMSGNGERYKGAITEAHSNNPVPSDVSSLDGSELMDIDTAGWLGRTQGNKITFRWTRLYNLRDQGPFKDPRKRTVSPTEPALEEYEHSTDPAPAPIAANFPCQPISAAVIWKPLAEDKGTGDPRANKPVMIADLGKSAVSLSAANGQEVGRLGYYGLYLDKRRGRYYSAVPSASNKVGYEFQKAAVAVSGSPYVYAKGGGKCIGPFLPGRRQGDYR